MLKKTIIALSIFAGLIILAVAYLFISTWASRPKTDKDFLSQLKGEVVFTRRNADGISDIWKINANGTDEKLLFHNNLNSFKTDSRNPLWSIDGEKIYFVSFDQNKKEIIYEMRSDGTDLKPAVNPDPKPADFSQYSREKDIKEFKGDLFITQNGQDVLIFKHSGYYSQDFAAGSGAREASWNPDKQYVIFEVDGTITVADKNGRLTKITNGNTPDWKY